MEGGPEEAILYLADRNVLVNQTMVNDFRPFGSAMAKLSTGSKVIEREDGTSVELPIAIVARDIRSHFKGRSVTRDEVIRYGLFKPDVLDSHVTKALTRLKQAKVAFPSGTKYRDTIKFAS